VHGFGIFQAWKGASENISSDGVPVSIDNYKDFLSAQSVDGDVSDDENQEEEGGDHHRLWPNLPMNNEKK
jgi:hypothetical protein